MNKMKVLYTPGPWTQEKSGEVIMAGQAVGFLAPDTAMYLERIANARLIAAAPALLAALRGAVESGAYWDGISRARTIIAKSEGR